jgi:putative spermidine/putrescine transport system permease protein
MTSLGPTAAVATAVLPPPPQDRPPGQRTAKGSILRWVVFIVSGIYFLGPLLAAFSFTIQNKTKGGISFSAYRAIFSKPPNGQFGITTALTVSLELAVISILVTLALMVPTLLLLHMRFTRVRPVVETISLLPLVFPPVVLVVGVSDTFAWTADHLHGPSASILTDIRSQNLPLVLAFLYVMLSMPFVYRALDAGIRSIDVTTLSEAARNLGAGWPTVVMRVLVPSLRTSIVNASFLCFALVMGEYTIASILLYIKPFPVWLVQLPTTSGQVQVATSVLSLLIVEVLLLLIGALNWQRNTDRSA